jgi:glyoxylase-like metal-dependent hydrolase (beta-lactamase superfamily II)
MSLFIVKARRGGPGVNIPSPHGRGDVMISNSFRLIEDRCVKVDSRAIFSGLPEALWVKRVELDRDYRASLPTYCLLLTIANKNILIDTGMGQPDNGMRNGETIIGRHMLLQGLKAVGVGPLDINFVILTHLNLDHLGGCARRDSDGKLFPTFPRARHLVQSRCWSEAISSTNTGLSEENAAILELLEQAGLVETILGDSQIMPGLEVLKTDGYVGGHQIAIGRCGGERLAFMGDLIPTHYHLDPRCTFGNSQDPLVTMVAKESMVAQAEKEGWLLTFSHGVDYKAGYVERRLGGLRFRPVIH